MLLRSHAKYTFLSRAKTLVSEFVLLSLSLSLSRIVEQDERVLHVLSSTSDRDKSLCRPALHNVSRSRSLAPSVYFQFSRAISVLAPFRIRLFLRLSCPPVLWMTVPLLWSSAPDSSVYSGANNATHTQTHRIAIHVGKSDAPQSRVCVCVRIQVCAYVEKPRLGNLGSRRAFHCRRTSSPGPTTYTHCRSCHPWLNCNDLRSPPRFLWRLIKSRCLPILSQTRRNFSNLFASNRQNYKKSLN